MSHPKGQSANTSQTHLSTTAARFLSCSKKNKKWGEVACYALLSRWKRAGSLIAACRHCWITNSHLRSSFCIPSSSRLHAGVFSQCQCKCQHGESDSYLSGVGSGVIKDKQTGIVVASRSSYFSNENVGGFEVSTRIFTFPPVGGSGTKDLRYLTWRVHIIIWIFLAKMFNTADI